MVVGGLAVIAVGTLPWIRYFYAPLGAGDRVNVVSSVGAAMAWAGIAFSLRRSRPALVGAAAAFLVLTSIVRVDRARTYAQAGAHVLELLDALDRSLPAPAGEIIIGPMPWERDNIAGLLDKSNVDAALQVHRRDRRVQGYMTFGEREFAGHPADRRFDLRRLDSYPAPPEAPYPRLLAPRG
jgi:hypothetical protein